MLYISEFCVALGKSWHFPQELSKMVFPSAIFSTELRFVPSTTAGRGVQDGAEPMITIVKHKNKHFPTLVTMLLFWFPFLILMKFTSFKNKEIYPYNQR